MRNQIQGAGRKLDEKWLWGNIRGNRDSGLTIVAGFLLGDGGDKESDEILEVNRWGW